MEKKTMIYNFGPDGRDACWAALTSSWTHFSKQQGLSTKQVSCDSSACSDVEAQFKDTTRTHNSWPVKSRRPTKKKKQNVLTATTTSLSPPPPQSLPPSPPKALKRRPDTQLRPALASDQLSSSAEVMTQTTSGPPLLTNGPCSCSQSANPELSGVKNVTGNNNNNDGGDDTDKDEWEYCGVTETTTDVVDRKQQRLMLCAADSGSSVDIREPDADRPIDHTLRNGGDHVSSASRPPTPSTVAERPIERALPDEGDRVSSAVVERPMERGPRNDGSDRVSSASRPPTPSAVAERPIDHTLRDGGDHVSSASRPPTPSTVAERPIERALPDEGDRVSSAVVERPMERGPQNGGDHVSTVPRPPTPSAVAERPIERALPNGGDHVSAEPRPQTPFAVAEKPTDAENPATMRVDEGYREVVSPALWPQLPLMTSTTDAENPMDITVVPPSSQSQPNDDEECPVQSNSSMIVRSEKPLSKYEMKIKEIDNSIISYSKSFLSTVLFVVLLRVLF